MSKSYQGHPSRAAWNVHLWLMNDEPLYRMCQQIVSSSRTLDRAATRLIAELDGQSTPDGVRYTKTNIRQALRHWGG